MPIDLRGEPQVVAVMRRLYLNAGDGGAGRRMSDLDPRELPGLQLHADEFGIGQRQIGRLDAEILADPLGLRLVSFESATDSFTAQGSGGWFVGDEGDTTRFAVGINSTNVGQMLAQLGFAPFVEAETAEVTASLFWPGPPSGAWLDHIGGDLALRAEKGSLVDVEPGGAGRAAGLLSISALPRRLALDFRDVFNRGLVFDDITADFVIVDGNAYTDNLKLTGPVAEVGLIGRTGLRDRDYRQQAVVTAEPGKVLPTVGALLAGPQVAAALLIFTRIFKKPLGGIGRASYCVTGSWSRADRRAVDRRAARGGRACARSCRRTPLRSPRRSRRDESSGRADDEHARRAGEPARGGPARRRRRAARRGARRIAGEFLVPRRDGCGPRRRDRAVRRRSRAAVPRRDGRELGRVDRRRHDSDS